MRYQAPTSESLKQFWSNLDQVYKGTNSKRLSQIEFLKTIGENKVAAEDKNLLLGALVFNLIKIANEYSYTNPQGSTLFNDLEKGLGITEKNHLTDTKKIIYLSALQKFINNNNIIFPGYKNAQSLCAEINTISKKLLDNSKHDIKILLGKRPSAEALLKNFAALPEKYITYKKSYTVRDKFIDFIKDLEKECIANHLDAAQITLQNTPESQDKKPFGYAVRFGALLYIMTVIESEYTLTSPQNSYLYQLCQQTTNISHTSKVSPEDQSLYFAEFCNFIPKINPKDQTNLQNKGFSDGEAFFLEMQKNLIDLRLTQLSLIKNIDSHPYLARIRDMILNATQFGVSICTPNVASNLVEFNLCRNLISGGAGMVGFTLYGPPGALIATQLGALVEQRLIPSTAQRFAGKAFQKVGTVIGYTTGQAVYLIISKPIDAVNSVLGLGGAMKRKNKDEELKPYDDKEWILALNDLPDSVFPEKDKAVIRTVESIPAPIAKAIESNTSTFKL